MSLIVRLPFPAAELFPNRKNGKHWTATKSIKDDQRFMAKLCTEAALNVTGPHEWGERIPVSLLYVMPDKRHRDLDNCHAASKALLDGMAEALGVDDRRFRPVLVDWVYGDKPGGLIAAVGVRIESGVNL